MKRLKFALAALILASSLTFTGCQDVSKTPRGAVSELESSSQINLREESFEAKAFLTVPVVSDLQSSSSPEISLTPVLESPLESIHEISSPPEFFEASPEQEPEQLPISGSEAISTPESETPTAPVTPQGNCPYCNGTGHHNNELCTTCHGTGYYEAPTAPQGNCPYCNGTGHHNNEFCTTCHGTGYYEAPTAPQGNCPYCNGTGHHNNELCTTCHGTGYYEEPVTPQGNCPYCNGTGYRGHGYCGGCSGTGFYTAPTSGGCHNNGYFSNSGHHGGHHCR